MKSSSEEITIAHGAPMCGGFYAGRIVIAGSPFALISAPKAEGECSDTIWIARSKAVPGARSYCDGLANTRAMAEAGSKLARWALDLRIADFDDWYLPAQDELELAYRNLKPSTEKNWCYARSGINLNSLRQGHPYTPEFPAQTQAEAFIDGGAEAFEKTAYWSSTQHASDSGYAWGQYFDDGIQIYWTTGSELRARAFRRSPIQSFANS